MAALLIPLKDLNLPVRPVMGSNFPILLHSSTNRALVQDLEVNRTLHPPKFTWIRFVNGPIHCYSWLSLQIMSLSWTAWTNAWQSNNMMKFTLIMEIIVNWVSLDAKKVISILILTLIRCWLVRVSIVRSLSQLSVKYVLWRNVRMSLFVLLPISWE